MGIVRIGRVDLLLDAAVRPNGPLVSVSCTMCPMHFWRSVHVQTILHAEAEVNVERHLFRTIQVVADGVTLALRILRTVYGDA